MSRPKIPTERKSAEGRVLSDSIERMKVEEPDLSQYKLADELGVTQGLVGQWASGKTNIPDKTLIWLGGRLRFDPYALRPGLYEYTYGGLVESGRAELVAKAVKRLTEASPEDFEKASRVLKAILDE